MTVWPKVSSKPALRQHTRWWLEFDSRRYEWPVRVNNEQRSHICPFRLIDDRTRPQESITVVEAKDTSPWPEPRAGKALFLFCCIDATLDREGELVTKCDTKVIDWFADTLAGMSSVLDGNLLSQPSVSHGQRVVLTVPHGPPEAFYGGHLKIDEAPRSTNQTPKQMQTIIGYFMTHLPM